MAADNELLRLEDLTAEQMASFINDLIDKDFSRLLQILYRLDVSEDKLRSVLSEHPTGDAGDMIAKLILERIAQREEAKKIFKTDNEIPDDEKW